MSCFLTFYTTLNTPRISGSQPEMITAGVPRPPPAHSPQHATQGDVQQCLNTVLVVIAFVWGGEGCYWHHLGRSQACC